MRQPFRCTNYPKTRFGLLRIQTPTGTLVYPLPRALYLFSTRKDIFEDRQDTVRVQSNKIFLKMGMQRKPGYLFKKHTSGSQGAKQ
jgi:hypothetical protein